MNEKYIFVCKILTLPTTEQRGLLKINDSVDSGRRNRRDGSRKWQKRCRRGRRLRAGGRRIDRTRALRGDRLLDLYDGLSIDLERVRMIGNLINRHIPISK